MANTYAQSPSPPPERLPSGTQVDAPYQPLAMSGQANPFFYHQFADDFDNLLGPTGAYTVTAASGSVVHTAGDGGLALFTTGATAGNFAEIQLPAADFTLPPTGTAPPGTSTTVKKLFFLVRLQLSDITLSQFIVGLCNITATPFSAIADGLYFNKVASSTQVNLILAASSGNSPSGSAVSYTLPIPSSVFNLTNATYFDLGFAIDRQQNILAYCGNQLVGYIPQSATGTISALTGGTAINTPAGPVASFQQTAPNGGTYGTPGPFLFTQANLSPTAAVSNGVTAVAKTMTLDFWCTQKER